MNVEIVNLSVITVKQPDTIIQLQYSQNDNDNENYIENYNDNDDTSRSGCPLVHLLSSKRKKNLPT